jgi:hypothetical protein
MMTRQVRWLGMLAGVAVSAGLAGCGSLAASMPPSGAGQSAGINMTLNTVPVVRSVTVSPAKGTFGNCEYGSASQDTGSASNKLGYPNGRCWYGQPEPHGTFPVTITNAGVASQIDISGQPALPSDNGDQWDLCNTGKHPVSACNGNHHEPGTDQYKLQNFSPDSGMNYSGISDDWLCDRQFTENGKCAVEPHGAFQTEGFELIGPQWPTDSKATSWTTTISWIAAPP